MSEAEPGSALASAPADPFIASLCGSAERVLREWAANRLDAAASAVDSAAEAARAALSDATADDAWADAKSARSAVASALARTRTEVADPLHHLLEELRIGDWLCGCAEDLVDAALEGLEALDPTPAPLLEVETQEEAWSRRAFHRDVAAERLPEAVSRALRAVASSGLEALAPVASGLTRWVRALWDAQHRLCEIPDTESHAESAEPDLGRVRSGVSARAEQLSSALDALRAWMSSAQLEDASESIRDALTAQVASFSPGSRKWRQAGAALEQDDGHKAGGAEVPAPCDPERFVAERKRIELACHLLRFDAYLGSFARSKLLAAADAAATEGCASLTTAVDALRGLADDAEARAETAASSEPPDVRRILRRGRAALSEAEQDLARLASDGRLTEGMVDGLRALMSRIGDLPAEVRVAPLVEEDGSPKLDAAPRRREVRAWARESIDDLLLDGLAESDEPYLTALDDAGRGLPRVRDIIEYNLGAAAERDELPPEGADELQHELLTSGLARAADRLSELGVALEEAARDARALPLELVLDAQRDFRDRARAEGRLEGQAREALGSVRRARLKTTATVGRQVGAGRRSGSALFRLASERLKKAVLSARDALGAAPPDRDRAQVTARAISEIDAAAERLPFVYRRLFSYRPLEDPALLVGRADISDELDRVLSRWEGGSTDAVLIVGTSGVGVTSLLRTTNERWLGRVQWSFVPLTRRVEDEREWAELLGGTLELDPVPTSLVGLEEALLARPRPAIAPVCAIENLEHLYFRGVLETGLIAPTLKLISATDSSVLWITSLPASAWEVVRATDPGLSALLRIIAVPPLGRADVEAAIYARHERSGIPLVFAESTDLPAGVRRALGRVSDSAERTAVLRRAFFDRLFELSEGYIALALLYWLRSIDPGTDANSMTVHWPERIDFAAWDELHADAGFALRAFLEHGSLTLSEYARLFGVGETAAFAVFERLGSLLIIEPVGQRRRVGSELAFRRVRANERYRIRPVLVRPVERLLLSRRLLY